MSVDTVTGAVPLSGGIEGAYRLFEIEAPKALVVVTHGLGEHGGRYDHVGRHLASHGYAAWIPDHRGHGLSGGKRGHVMGFDQYAADLLTHVKEAQRRVPGVPWFLLGHSMGGLITTHYCQTHASHLPVSLLLSSPLFQVAMEVPAAKAAVGRVMSKVWPSLTMPTGLAADFLSHDPRVNEAYKRDPLVHDKVSTRWFTSLEETLQSIHQNAPNMRLPVLSLVAGDDRLVAAEGARRFFRALGSPDKKEIVYEGWYHEIFNEPQQAQPLGEVTTWLDAHLPR